jgi:DNA-binding HxlR family transcriptional regulator
MTQKSPINVEPSDSEAADESLDKMRDCPVMTTVVVMGGRWKPRVLWHLRSSAASFSELQRATGASERMLSKSLRELEADNIVTRTVVPIGKVVMTRYAFSDYGLTLAPVLDAMGDWGLQHQHREVHATPMAEPVREG